MTLPRKLTLGLTSRAAAVAEDVRRLAGAVGGRLAPPAASGALAAAAAEGFLSEVVAAVVEGAERRAGVAAAAPELGRVLGDAATAVAGLAALAAGCHMGAPSCTGVGGGPNEEGRAKRKEIKRNKK